MRKTIPTPLKKDHILEDHFLARANQLCPLTRRGPSINGATEPDVVEHAGNIALMRSVGRHRQTGLGVVSLNGGSNIPGLTFKEDIGISYAAPQVAHKAARLLAAVPNASPDKLRARIGAHTRWPKACEALLGSGNRPGGRDRLLQPIGYGRVDDAALCSSLDHTVPLLAEERIDNDQHHFLELPLPEAFGQRAPYPRNLDGTRLQPRRAPDPAGLSSRKALVHPGGGRPPR